MNVASSDPKALKGVSFFMRLNYRQCLGLDRVDRVCHIEPGSYDATKLSQGDRNYLFNYFGHSGEAPVGYGGENVGATTGGGAPTVDPIAQAQKLLEFQRQANQPAISSLQAQIPEIDQRTAQESARLQGEKEPLKQRYQSIIDQLTGREKQDIGLAQQRTSREFGYRGIPASSTLYLDELQRAESPIRQAYGGQIKDVGFEQEQSLRGIDQLLASLGNQGIEQKRGIANAMAALQSGDPSQAIQGAMQILQMQQQQGQFQQQQGLAEKEFGLKREIANRPQQQDQFAQLGEGSTLFNLLTGQPMYTAPKTYKPEDQFGAGNYYNTSTNTTLPSYFTPAR